MDEFQRIPSNILNCKVLNGKGSSSSRPGLDNCLQEFCKGNAIEAEQYELLRSKDFETSHMCIPAVHMIRNHNDLEYIRMNRFAK